jgi:hypothetical protein
MDMTENVGATDRKARIAAGAVLLAIALFALTGVFAWIVGLVGAVALATGLMKVCPAYRLLGLNTCAPR